MTPPNGSFVLDTNIVIALLESDQTVVLHAKRASRLLIPAVVFGELFFGAAKSSRSAANVARLERFAAGRSIVPCDLNVAREYGHLKQRLKAKGRPVPDNDIWIAATALHLRLVLATRDRHFSEVEGLTTSDWTVAPHT